MAVEVSDLQPKPFTITVKGVDLTCSPLRLSHALVVAKIGEVFQNPKDCTTEQIKQAEADMDGVIGELIPDIKGVQLGMQEVIEVITAMMTSIQPSENKELTESGVKAAGDPKVPRTGQ